MSLSEKLNRKLDGGKFRLLNEKMYRGKGLGKGNLQLYHELYGSQVTKWPVNPLDVIIQRIKKMNSELAIADIGCGEARIAKEFKNVVSLDIHPVTSDVVHCDMSKKIPLDDESMDVAVCCLSMMMSNITSATREVNRILKKEGYWYVAEVRSRIESVNMLGKRFESFGFDVEYVDVTSKQFVLYVLKKRELLNNRRKKPILLIPCMYKKR
ncbi:putative methyltransferase [Ordospora colligata]|uniref:Ribosomal RNA-processing protein 8 n=1 Tax=Ordospora colligata OC4 TaxID=1354746 RepID=A0A0B2UL05_9MICR|nr:putative methyltransferase [Ordospora colligata OC4]KHN69665.1 putative methyltransferase [Ordospora colligata OC4]TBU15784.1 putative methyltransferase [Ordospora colligata]TBU15912.1 putative methyltransferase [Ordospora colligata]TBU18806.1 putative methyltransferase [Ordospora colligata]